MPDLCDVRQRILSRLLYRLRFKHACLLTGIQYLMRWDNAGRVGVAAGLANASE
jgi:hypothetical protein